MSQVITVENTFAQPLPVEIRVDELTLDANGVRGSGKDPGDLLIFPTQALIQPGQTQTFRVQFVGDPEMPKSKHYYATVAQLPVKLPEGQSAIQILYNFQVLVSVAPGGVKPALKVESAEVATNDAGKPVPALTLSNSSTAHGYLSKGRLRLIQRDASGKEVFRRTLSGPEVQQTIGFGLVGAGQKRRVLIPIELPVQGGSLEAQFTPEG
jgi:fimbrial chaperone protein